MPKVIDKKGFRFFFYSNEHDPIHIHVEKNKKIAAFRIKPVSLTKNKRFSKHELNSIKEIIFENQILIEEKWNEHFKK